LALLAASAALAATAFAVSAAPAGAEYFWGCTYSWEHVCFAPPTGAQNYLVTLDPDHALGIGFYSTQNGYPGPKYDGRTRDVCGGVWNGSAGQDVPWSCSWGENAYTFEYAWGKAMIGAGQYYNIALYQIINWTEPGP
jgi:hypothetical protein